MSDQVDQKHMKKCRSNLSQKTTFIIVLADVVQL